MAMMLGIAGLVYTWVQDMEANVQGQTSAKTTSVMQALEMRVRIVTFNSTKDGIILENNGKNNLTSATVWVNGNVTAMNLALQNQISPGSFGIVPLNATVTGQSAEIKVLVVDSQGTVATAQAAVSTS